MAQLLVPVLSQPTVQKGITVLSLQSYQRPTSYSQSGGESVHDRPVSAGTDVNLQQTHNFVSKHLHNSLRCIIQKSHMLTSLRMAQLSLSLCTFSRITLIGPSCGSTAPSAMPMASNLPEGDRVYQES
jgi:hypothetical protein